MSNRALPFTAILLSLAGFQGCQRHHAEESVKVVTASPSKELESRLLAAIREDNPRQVREMIAAGLDLESGDDEGTLGAMGLTHAGTYGAVNAALELLAAGVSPDATVWGNKGGLSESAAHGNYGTFELLVEAGVDVASTQAVWAAELAASAGHLDMLRLLVGQGYDVNAQPDRTLSSPLLSAANGGHLDVVRYLLEQGADPTLATEFQNKDGTEDLLTPYEQASQKGHREVAKLLEEALAERR